MRFSNVSSEKHLSKKNIRTENFSIKVTISKKLCWLYSSFQLTKIYLLLVKGNTPFKTTRLFY